MRPRKGQWLGQSHTEEAGRALGRVRSEKWRAGSAHGPLPKGSVIHAPHLLVSQTELITSLSWGQ